MPLVAGPWLAATELIGEGLTEFAAPLVDGFVGDQNTAGQHQFRSLSRWWQRWRVRFRRRLEETLADVHERLIDFGMWGAVGAGEGAPGAVGCSRCEMAENFICESKHTTDKVQAAFDAFTPGKPTIAHTKDRAN